MAQPHLDHPGEVTWFVGHGPAPILGDCPHDCRHMSLTDVAWGPDLERYTLVVCGTDAGCAGTCRAWVPERPWVTGPDGEFICVGEFKHFDVEHEVRSTRDNRKQIAPT